MVHSISVQPADYSQLMGQDFSTALVGDIPAGVVKLIPAEGAAVDAQKLVLTANKIAIFASGIGFAVIQEYHEDEHTFEPLRLDLVDGPAKFYPPGKIWIPQGKTMIGGVEHPVVYTVEGVQESYDAISYAAPDDPTRESGGGGQQGYCKRNMVIAVVVCAAALLAITAMVKLTQGFTPSKTLAA